jgi:hypothetical protein
MRLQLQILVTNSFTCGVIFYCVKVLLHKQINRGDVLLRRRFVPETLCYRRRSVTETFCYGDVLSRRRFVRRRFVFAPIHKRVTTSFQATGNAIGH